MQFYVLENPRIKDSAFATDFLKEEPVIQGEPSRCELCGRFVGMIPWLAPHRAMIEPWGREYGDIVFGFGFGLLVSEKFKNAWLRSTLKGLEGFDPVEILKVRKHKKIATPPPRYFLVSVQRSRAAIDAAASGLERDESTEVEVCPECRKGGGVKRTRRVVLQRSTWSGEDIFIARGLPGTYIASERFKDFCERNQVKNAVLIPALEYSFDFYPWEKSNKSESG
jgi:hypothetical protein